MAKSEKGRADAEPAVLVGGGQCLQRDAEPDRALGPIEMMAIAAREAAQEARVGARVFDLLDTVAVVDVTAWRPHNAARLLADAVGARPRTEIVTALGGESPLLLVNHLAREIGAGRIRAALVAGSNNIRTLQRARKAGLRLAWPTGGDGDPTRIGVDKPGTSPEEQRYGVTMPVVVYPLFENALRAKRGLDLATHRACMGALMSRFTRVAAANPHAWFQTARTPEELTTPGTGNRMVAFPYPKRLNAVIDTDQAAATLLLSAEAARDLGIAPARWVHVWGGGSAVEEAWFPCERPSFAACDGLRRAATAALADAGSELDEMAALDLYSCFPVAVEMACEMLGLAEDDARGLTVTGGLPYFGGPGNNYSLHALVTMAERLRAQPGARGLVTGNGWYFTKHSATVLAAAPRAEGDASTPPPELPSAGPPVALSEVADGDATVETYTVLFERDGAPSRGILVGRLAGGERFLANTPADRALLEDLCAREGVGRTGRVSHEDGRNLFRPS